MRADDLREYQWTHESGGLLCPMDPPYAEPEDESRTVTVTYVGTPPGYGPGGGGGSTSGNFGTSEEGPLAPGGGVAGPGKR